MGGRAAAVYYHETLHHVAQPNVLSIVPSSYVSSLLSFYTHYLPLPLQNTAYSERQLKLYTISGKRHDM